MWIDSQSLGYQITDFLALIIFEEWSCLLKGFRLQYFWDIPQRSHVGNIWRPDDKVKDVTVATFPGTGTPPGPGNILEWASNVFFMG